MTALADYKAFLAQARAYLTAGDHQSALLTSALARAQLLEIPDVESSSGEKAAFERGLDGLDAAIRKMRGEVGAASRRNRPSFATITPAATGSGE